MAQRDYYEILGIDRTASDDAMKKAYRNLAMKYHPDRNPNDPESPNRMKEINEAYAVLSDPNKRQLYDLYGHAGLAGYTQEDLLRSADFGEMLRGFGLWDSGFGDSLFDSFFRSQDPRRAGAPRRGTDLRYELEATLEEAASGVEKTISIPREERCPVCAGIGADNSDIQECRQCHGSGQVVREQRAGFTLLRQITTCTVCQGRGQRILKPCPECQGRGSIETARDVEVAIPRGADAGYQSRIRGGGEPGEYGGEPGDLWVVLRVQKHPLFERHNDDIYLQQEISFAIAALGGEEEVPGLDGNSIIHIPEGTQTGTVFRIEEKGISHLKGKGRGDQYVIVKVVTPTNLSKREKELLREFAKLRKEHKK